MQFIHIVGLCLRFRGLIVITKNVFDMDSDVGSGQSYTLLH